jgi:hypothetical protein
VAWLTESGQASLAILAQAGQQLDHVLASHLVGLRSGVVAVEPQDRVVVRLAAEQQAQIQTKLVESLVAAALSPSSSARLDAEYRPASDSKDARTHWKASL